MRKKERSEADLINKAAIDAGPQVSLDDKDEEGSVKGKKPMDLFAKAFLKVRERSVRFNRAQTMTEYVMIVSAIAIVVYGTYLALGNNISSFANGADRRENRFPLSSSRYRMFESCSLRQRVPLQLELVRRLSKYAPLRPISHGSWQRRARPIWQIAVSHPFLSVLRRFGATSGFCAIATRRFSRR